MHSVKKTTTFQPKVKEKKNYYLALDILCASGGKEDCYLLATLII